MDKLDELYSALEKSMTKRKEGAAQLHDASSVRMLSFVDHGIPTRQPMLDLCMGHPGIPIGKTIEFFGFERSGKTTAAYHIAGSCLRMGGTVLFIDTEMGFDLDRAMECGVPMNPVGLKVINAASIDAIFRTIDDFLDKLKEVSFDRDALIIVDSVTAVECEFNLQNDFKAQGRMGEDARTIRRGIRRIGPKLAELKVPTVFINHAIETGAAYGAKLQAAGGHGLKFSTSLRVLFENEGEIKDPKKEGVKEQDRKRYGQTVKISIPKLRMAHLEKQTFTTRLMNEGGFDSFGQLLDACVEVGAIRRKAGSPNYTIVSEGKDVTTFTRSEWEDYVANHGGYDSVYEWWFTHAQKQGLMLPWNASKFAEVVEEE